MRKAVADRQNYDKEHKELTSFKKLQKEIARKLRTCFIGDLARIEKFFGKYWGHGLSYDKLSPAQQKIYQLYQDLRTDILNAGNKLIRGIEMDLKQYTILLNKQYSIINKR